jgi:hypothetical protein
MLMQGCGARDKRRTEAKRERTVIWRGCGAIKINMADLREAPHAPTHRLRREHHGGRWCHAGAIFQILQRGPGVRQCGGTLDIRVPARGGAVGLRRRKFVQMGAAATLAALARIACAQGGSPPPDGVGFAAGGAFAPE